MDLNQLLHHHQRALIDTRAEISPEGRRWAGLTATFYADRIAEARRALGREDPFTWAFATAARPVGGVACCG